jgi:hypothetical protein
VFILACAVKHSLRQHLADILGADFEVVQTFLQLPELRLFWSDNQPAQFL